ncbi:unnamed protein product [Lampetra planeri]
MLLSYVDVRGEGEEEEQRMSREPGATRAPRLVITTPALSRDPASRARPQRDHNGATTGPQRGHNGATTGPQRGHNGATAGP